MIKIGRPIINSTENIVTVSAIVEENGNLETIWFKTEKKWEKYLVSDRNDTFLLCILPHAMKENQNICSDAPISQSLLYQLNHFQIPCSSKYIEKNNRIEIIAPAIEDISEGERHVATGISNGVDSLYSIFKNLSEKKDLNNFNIDLLAYFSVGAAGDFGGKEEEELSEKRLLEVKKFAKDINMEIVVLESNINEIYDDEYYLNVVSYRLAACVLLLQKLLGVYYLSTGYEIQYFHFPEDDPEYYDILNCQNFSTAKTRIYSYGLEASRMEKLNFISNYDLTKKYLQVCQTSHINCNRCEKCYRTMCELDMLGKLELYENVFDVDYYRNNREKILGYGIAHRRGRSFWEDIYYVLKKNRKITFKMRMYWFYYVVRSFMSTHLKGVAQWYKSKKKNPYAKESEQYKDLYVRL